MIDDKDNLVAVPKDTMAVTDIATLKAVRTSARDEIILLKDLLDAALKREKELVRLSEKKARKMIAAGERWEKKHMGRLKKAADKARARIKS